jgi:ribosomal protein S27AE
MSETKTCFKCNAIKPFEMFYKHSGMADGHVNKCKECNKNDVTTYRNKNLEKVRAYDRQRGKEPERAKVMSAFTKAWRSEDKRRIAAHNAVARAIKKGSLLKLPCVRCGTEKSVAHHEDYSKFLDVMWLCSPCHRKRHKELNLMNGTERIDE